MITPSPPSRRPLSLLALSLLALAVLAGCAAKEQKVGPVFFPPPPNEPRVQYLWSFMSSKDVVKKAGISFFRVVGGDVATDHLIERPYGLRYHRGKLYVCDLQGPQVYIIDLRNQSFEPLKGNAGFGKLRRPINLTLDGQGRLFVVDNSRNEVLAYDAAGNHLRNYGKELLQKPADVAVDAQYLYVLDLKGNDIKVFGVEDGRFVRTIGKTEGEVQGLSIPTNFTLTPQGTFYATNVGTANVLKLDRDGHILDSFGEMGDGFGQFARPKGVALDEEGRIYVVDAGHMNVQIFNQEYRLLMFFGNPPLPAGVMNLPAGVAVTTEDLDYFQKFAEPGFELERVIFVTNQSGPDRVAIYGMGHRKGMSN